MVITEVGGTQAISRATRPPVPDYLAKWAVAAHSEIGVTGRLLE
jgi:hypothetical protein